jgi:hypothetical protein
MSLLRVIPVLFFIFLKINLYAQTGIITDFSGNSTSGWAGTNPSHFVLSAANQELKIISSSVGYENLEFEFSPVSIIANPIVTLKVKAAGNFNLRVDLQDASGKWTGLASQSKPVTGNGNYQTVTFDFKDKFPSGFDAARIVTATFFFNPGTGYSGTVYFDDVTIGDPIPFLPGKILINQIGYEQEGPKVAIYQSNLTELSTDSFYVMDNNNKIVHRGLGTYEGQVAGWTTGNYWRLNFSEFESAGNFKIKMKAGNLYSYSFKIDQNLLFNETASKVVSFFNKMRHTGTADKSLSFYGSRSGTVDVHGGWIDATGDPGKHMSHLSYANYFNPQQIPFVVWSLLKSYSLNPDAYAAFDEALLSEAAFGADYIIRNVDPAGYLYISIFDDWGNSPLRQITEWGQAPDCDYCRSANYQAAMREGAGVAIAALARASRMDISVGEYTPAQYLAKAEILYNHLKSPGGSGYATKNLEYCNDHTENIIDFYCGLLASTELYKTTQNVSYLTDASDYAAKLMALQKTGGYLSANVAGTRPFNHAADEGLPVISLIEYAEANPSQRPAVAGFLLEWVDWYKSLSMEVNNPFSYARQYASPYKGGTSLPAAKSFFIPHDNETGYWWQGENARLASMTSALLASYRFLGNYDFSGDFDNEFAIAQIDWVLGKNPFDVCMMTGVGTTTYPTYLGGAKYPNYVGGICNGITAKDKSENDIAWAPYAASDWQNWRWVEQWLPHDAWFLVSVAQLNAIVEDVEPLPLSFSPSNKNGESIFCFPVPFQNELSVQLPSGSSPEMIKVLNVLGDTQKLIENPSGNTFNISTENWAPGLYFVEVHTQGKIKTIKVIK